MNGKQIFVGRQEELEEFKKVLENPQGQAVIVVGQAGMGKTFLVNKMAEIALKYPGLKCGCVRYEVTPTDSVDSTMALMMDNAFEAAATEAGSFDNVPERRKQWMALLKTIVPKGDKIAELIDSLRRDPAKNTREQFIERLNLISKRMPKNGRAIFIIDPEKYMQEKSDQSWAIVVKQLPEKVKFVFAQRNEDMLVDSETFNSLDNVVCIPEKRLDVLDEPSVDELIGLESANIKYPISEIKKVISGYKGHPYAVGAALGLLKAEVKLEELPKRPEPIKFAEIQWKEICKRGEEAIRLFRAYAILEIGVPEDIIEYVSGLDNYQILHLLADNYLKGLLREEGEGKRIYHSILTEYILGQMGNEEKKKYHLQAVKIYRGKLKKARTEQTKPDELAATRLPEHVLAAEGQDAFAGMFINECYRPLFTLGVLDMCISLSERALKMVKDGSERHAMLLCNLGIIYVTRGELEKAEEMHKKAFAINEKLGRQEGMAIDYAALGLVYYGRRDLGKAEKMHFKGLEIEKKLGRLEGMARQYGNLGLIYLTRGDLDKAEEMHKKALAIEEKLGRLEGVAIDYGNLGLIYQNRGELDKAEEMHKKALEIDERIGNQLGVATHYGNLGIIYLKRGDLDKAEEMHKKSLQIEEKLGRLEGMANAYGNLGLIYDACGDLDKAEEMNKKALEIDEKIGNQEGMAHDYCNLGNLYEKKGDLKKAKEYWLKARDLYEKIGMPNEVKEVQGWIDSARPN
jgi:tetratricopeptide (TPR) repeat protein/KaiC/GvpD/RAD55 family RecA-like ATPase